MIYECVECLFYDLCEKEYTITPTTPACESFELLHVQDEIHNNNRYQRVPGTIP